MTQSRSRVDVAKRSHAIQILASYIDQYRALEAALQVFQAAALLCIPGDAFILGPLHCKALLLLRLRRRNAAMQISTGQDSIQRLIAAEQEAQKIIAAARKGMT